MLQSSQSRWTILIVVNVLAYCVLSFYQPSHAAPQPFANAEEQRFEQLAVLKEIAAELKAQTAPLRSGSLQVIAVPPKK